DEVIAPVVLTVGERAVLRPRMAGVTEVRADVVGGPVVKCSHRVNLDAGDAGGAMQPLGGSGALTRGGEGFGDGAVVGVQHAQVGHHHPAREKRGAAAAGPRTSAARASTATRP